MTTRERLLRAILAVSGVAPVWALLAWTAGLGPFHVWFLATGAPAVVALVVLGILARADRWPETRACLTAGVVGGLLGTIGYDLFRVPFSLLGYRLFAPIDSYGILLLDQPDSSGWTAIVGWSFHFLNGIGFAIAYLAVARRRHPAWALLWAMLLETATVATAFADVYGLRGQPDVIAIAYAAHVPYGLALGWIARRSDNLVAGLRETGRGVVAWLLALLAAVLVLWFKPWSEPAADAAGRAVADGPSAVVRDGRFHPSWLRIAPGGCLTLRNEDTEEYEVTGLDASLVRGAPVRLCPSETGVRRLQLSGIPYSGGFVIVDQEA